MKYTTAAYLLTVTIISFLGYCVENIWLAVTQQYINNRNMYLPFLLGYGLTVVGIYLIFGTPKKWLRRKPANKYAIACRIGGAIEYKISYIKMLMY